MLQSTGSNKHGNETYLRFDILMDLDNGAFHDVSSCLFFIYLQVGGPGPAAAELLRA